MCRRVSMSLLLLAMATTASLLLGVARASTGVCDYCKCPQEGDAVTIECHCCPDMRDIDFSERLMKPADNMTRVTKLIVSDCNSVSFRQNSLYSLKNLDQLDIVNVSRVNFDIGAFEKVGSLRVEKVATLDLAENAFFATQLRQLSLTATKIQRLPAKALANVAGLASVRLEDVVVEEMSSSAVFLDMPAPSEFLIKGCLMKDAQTASLTIKSVGKFEVHGSTFRNLDSGAFNVAAQVSAMVNGSDLAENVPPQAVCVAAPEVTVVGNRFDRVPECLLANNQSSSKGPRKVVFQRNKVDADLLSLVALTGDSVKYGYNRLSCDCVVEFGKKLSAIGQRDPWVLDNNYCDTTSCPNQLPMSVLVKYLEEAKGAGHCSEEELCKRAPTTTTTTTTTATPHTQARGGAKDTLANVCSVLSLLTLSLVWTVL